MGPPVSVTASYVCAREKRVNVIKAGACPAAVFAPMEKHRNAVNAAACLPPVQGSCERSQLMPPWLRERPHHRAASLLATSGMERSWLTASISPWQQASSRSTIWCRCFLLMYFLFKKQFKIQGGGSYYFQRPEW